MKKALGSLSKLFFHLNILFLAQGAGERIETKNKLLFLNAISNEVTPTFTFRITIIYIFLKIGGAIYI